MVLKCRFRKKDIVNICKRDLMMHNRLLAYKVIDMDDLEDFSDLLKESIKIYVKISMMD